VDFWTERRPAPEPTLSSAAPRIRERA
jgi:hypothetical protein